MSRYGDFVWMTMTMMTERITLPGKNLSQAKLYIYVQCHAYIVYARCYSHVT